jgi:ubiquinone/menaquinone biosynthesis C-methylase UbiE
MRNASRDAWQALYSKHGMQYGGTGDLSMLKSVIAKGMLVLDAGCGDGKTTEVLAREAEVVGCDFSKEALVSLRVQRDSERTVNLVECELGKLPFRSKKFDAISCVHALSHMDADDRDAAARELTRVLKKGSHLFAEVFGSGDLRSGVGREVEPGSFLFRKP